MILVLLGTFPAPFLRPLKEIEQLCKDGFISENVIVQNGYTAFKSQFLTFRPFISPDDLDDLYKEANLIIAHAGTGSLIKGLKFNKKVIAIARLAKFGEVVDDHQVEILEEFAKHKYIIPWRENIPLRDILTIANGYSPKEYISNKKNIISFLTDYIDTL